MKKLLCLLFLVIIKIDLHATDYLLISENTASTLPVPDDPSASFLSVQPSLKDAHTYIEDVMHWSDTNSIDDDLIIYIADGTYYEGNLTWKLTSPDYHLTIKSYPGHRPVFDGTRQDVNPYRSKFLYLADSSVRYNKSQVTNFHLEGLTIRNFYNGVSFGGVNQSLPAGQIDNGHNSIKKCTFKNIGNRIFSDDLNDFQTTFGDSSKYPIGYSAVNMTRSGHNIISDNFFITIENRYRKGLVHAVYLNDFSVHNQISNNYISYCSGTPINLRNGSDFNQITGNYIEFAAQTGGFVYEWRCLIANGCDADQAPSKSTLIKDNTFTFIHPDRDPGYINDEIALFSSVQKGIDYEAAGFYIDGGGNFSYGRIPICEKAGASASGDINGDGTDELYVALNYADFTKIVRTEPGTDPYLSKVVYAGYDWQCSALAVSDMDDNGTKELITAFNSRTPNSDRTQVYKSDGISDARQVRLFSHSWWITAALTSGDYDGNGTNEVFVAFNAPDASGADQTQIFKGSGSGSAPLSNQGKLYAHAIWRTAALSSGDYDGDGTDEILVALEQTDANGSELLRVYEGNGTSSVHGLGALHSGSDQSLLALTSGDIDHDGNTEVAIAIRETVNSSTTNKIYRGEGSSSVKDLGLMMEYVNKTPWMLQIGNYFDFGSGEIAMYYSEGDEGQLHYGNGETSLTDLNSYYKSQENFACISTANRSSRNDKTEETEVDETQSNELLIFPNPADRSGYVYFHGITENAIFNIYDHSGSKQDYVLQNNKLDLKGLPAGFYIITIEERGKRYSRKLIVR